MRGTVMLIIRFVRHLCLAENACFNFFKIAFSLCFLLASGGPLLAQITTHGTWRLDSFYQREAHHLKRKLSQPCSAQWQNVSLQHVTERLTQTFDLSIFIDRRIDLTTTVTFQASETSLEDVTHQVIETSGYKLLYLGEVIFIGPSVKHLEKLQAVSTRLHHQVVQLGSKKSKRWLEKTTLKISRLNTPREVLEKQLTAAKIKVTNLKLLPHDLWKENSLPSLDLVDQLSLILIGFDLTFEISSDGSSITLIKIPQTIRWTHRYPIVKKNSLKKIRATWWKKFQRDFPKATIVEHRNQRVVTSGYQGHAAIFKTVENLRKTGKPPKSKRKKSQQANAPTKKTTKQYTLTIKDQPVGSLLKVIASKTDLTITFDEAAIQAAKKSLQTRVSCSVTKVTLEELLRAITSPAGLRHTLHGKALLVLPAE